MQKGSLVRIKESGNPKLIGSYGLVVRVLGNFSGFVIIHRFVDGREDSYHQRKLEVLA